MLRSAVLGVVVMPLLSTSLGQAATQSWPEIAPLEASVYFADASKAAAWFKVLDPKGKPLYLLQCYHWRAARDPDFDYSGDFECRLTSTYMHDKYSTLLTDDPQQSRDWQSRGRVLADELFGKCADYPEYGQVRHFRLRKIKITLSFDELSLKPYRDPSRPNIKSHMFQSLCFSLRVEPDPTALSQIAEPVPFLPPPRARPGDPNDFSLNCDVVIKRK